MGNISVVTGGAGFIGSHLADRLLADNDTVIVVDNLASGRRENVPAGAVFVEADVADAKAMMAVAREHSPTRWFHLAAQADVRVSVEAPLMDATTNVLGTLAVLAASELTRAPVILASTGGAIYGPNSVIPTTEDAAEEPLSPYGAAKLAAEGYARTHSRLYGVRHAIVRYANVYGPRQDPHGEAGVVAIFGGRILAGEPVTIFGDGTQTRDYIYVGDVVDATVAASQTVKDVTGPDPEPGAAAGVVVPIYNVGTGIETSVNELWETMTSVAESDPGSSYAAPRPGELARSALDASHIKADLNVQLATDLASGLAVTVDWMAGRQPAGVSEGS